MPGTNRTDSGLIEGFTQSPLLPFWINAGVYIFEPEATELLPVKGAVEFTKNAQQAFQGKMTAQQAMDDAATKIDPLLAQG